MLLAYLPFMIYPYDLFRTGVAALWIVLFLWLTVAFFWSTRRFFPGRSLKHAFFLWLIVWAQAVWTLTKLPPYWIVSVFFLAPVSFLEGPVKTGRVFSRHNAANPTTYHSAQGANHGIISAYFHHQECSSASRS